jgi:hypothetical protein
LGDEILCQDVALLEEQISFCYLPFDALGFALTIALRRQTVCGDAMRNQVIDHALCPSLG